MKPQVLLIDDDREFVEDFLLLLEDDFRCRAAFTGDEGFQLLKTIHPDLVLLDLVLGDDDSGLDLLRKIHNYDEHLPVIIITDYASVDTAVQAIRMGAADYISKAPNLNKLKLLLEKSLRDKSIRFQTRYYQEQIQKPFHAIIGNSPVIRELFSKIRLSAESLNTVLIHGESGVGKELVARQIHQHSSLANKAFVAVNCAAVPRDLLDSELFGHEKGAFTGARSRRIGKFEIASGGIIFFDEISELSQDAQVKLLRVMQEKEFERVGGNKLIRTDAKIIAATNKDLYSLVQNGTFREDLFFRLDVFPIFVPPLRERKDDIPLLIDHFLKEICMEMKTELKKFSPEAVKIFMDYNWPGNVRELKNLVTRVVIISKDTIIYPGDFETRFFKQDEDMIPSMGSIPETWTEMDRLRREVADKASRKVEKQFIENLLEKFNGNITKAAEHAGINRTNLHKMIKRCGLKL